MRHASLTLALSTTLALALTAPSRAVADHRPQGAALLDEEFARGFVDDDLDALTALYADDAVLFNIGGPPAVGRTAIREALAGFLAAFDVVDFEHDEQHYTTTGNLSAGWATFTITVVPRAGGPSFPISGRSTTVARRVGRDWYYVHDHASLPQ